MPLGRRADLGDAKYAGVEVPFAHDMEDAMQVSSGSGSQQLRRRPMSPTPTPTPTPLAHARPLNSPKNQNNIDPNTDLPQLRLRLCGRPPRAPPTTSLVYHL